MAAGIAALVKEIDPSILVIGVEPTGANKMAISLKTGKRVSLDNVRLPILLAFECMRPCKSLSKRIIRKHRKSCKI
jgi:threonine dehydratase